jgi:hypothetical protein
MEEVEEELHLGLADLESGDDEARILALERLGDVIGKIANRVVDALVRHPAHSASLQPLLRFGSVIIDPLEHQLDLAVDDRTRVSLSTALLFLGSGRGRPYLLEAVQPDNPDLEVVVVALSSAPVLEAGDRFEEALRRVDPNDEQAVGILLQGMSRLFRQVPGDIRERLHL